jgi:hypothetical protein
VAFASAGGGAPNLAPGCPVNVPKAGDTCGTPCGGAQLSCNYDCAHGNGYVSTATCNGGLWEIRQSLMDCEAADAATDAPDSG